MWSDTRVLRQAQSHTNLSVVVSILVLVPRSLSFGLNCGLECRPKLNYWYRTTSTLFLSWKRY